MEDTGGIGGKCQPAREMTLLEAGPLGGRLTISGFLAGAVMGVAVLSLLWWIIDRAAWRRVAGGVEKLPTGVAIGAVALLGGILFALALIWIQHPLQMVLRLWIVATVASTNPVLLLLPTAVLSGVVQEPAKLLAVLVARAQCRRREIPGREGRRLAGDPAADALLYGVPVGIGAGALEAAMTLSHALAMAPSAGALLPVFVERASALVFHGSLTGLVAYAWSAGRGWLVLVIAALTHGLLNYVVVLLSTWLGLGGVWLIEAVVAAVAVALMLLLRRAVARQPQPPETGRPTSR
ncbi:MAG TPA: hypothetical protein DHW14_06665 [Clostridiales bacterium]|nr:hypothetical protein [Clostridiales bacterium]